MFLETIVPDEGRSSVKPNINPTSLSGLSLRHDTLKCG